MSYRVWHVSLLSLVIAARVFMGGKPTACAADSQTEPKTLQFFVSPQGDDAWSGRLADPAVSDGPFATIGRAQQAVREVRKTHGGTVRVVLRSGTYYLDQPLQFGPEDSGRPCGSMGEGEYPTTYAAAAGERAIISGGRRLRGGHWGEVNGRKAWVVDIPEVKDGTWRFTQLFVNGERRPRTRLPKEGYYHIKAVPGRDAGQGSDDIDGDRRFTYAAGDIEPWRNLQDAEIVSAATCVASRLHILSVNAEQRLVTFDRTSRGPLMYGGSPVYWAENVLEALDTPGQWYLDRPHGRLYYLPKAGEDMEKAEIIAPRLPQLVRVAGTKEAPVKHLRFEGITFSHTEWQEPPDWPKEGRYTGAWYDIPAAIRFTHATRCSVTGCVIEHGVAYGVEVREGSRDVEISRNRMSDLGAGGVKIWFNSARTTVADNEIGHTGMIFLTSYAILVGDSPGNQIIYNHIYDRHYTGILVGWAMQFEESNAYGNVVEHNHIHDIGRGVMSDMGGIYTEGICAGTRIRYNVVHDVRARLGDNNGIYHDSGADILVEKNLVYRCTPLHIHYTRNITLENNIFALGETDQVTRAGVFDRPLLEYTFRRNIIYFNQGRVVGSWNPNNRNCVYDRNLFWNASGKALLFGDKSFAEWQAAGKDLHGLIADPLFVDPEKGDFRLRPGSPAEQIGFEPWDLTAVGPRHHSGASKQKLVSALGDAGSALPQAVPSVGKHKMLELIFTAAGTPANPFDTYLLKLEVTDPAGRIVTVEGFYHGDGSGGQAGQTWKVRLCPYRTGRWMWRTVPGDAPDGGLAGLSGQFNCVESGTSEVWWRRKSTSVCKTEISSFPRETSSTMQAASPSGRTLARR